MTRLGLWRTAVDLHVEELDDCISTSVHLLAWLMGEDAPRFPPEETPMWVDLTSAWVTHEHALANYGAVLCHRHWVISGGKTRPEAPWFALKQREIRKLGYPYSRPQWATDISVLTGHRQILLKLRPEWYAPKFDMTPREEGAQ